MRFPKLIIFLFASLIINSLFADYSTLMEGKNFLEENAKREEVVTLESGLQYEILTEGEGKIPKYGDNVACYYTGYFIDEEIFDEAPVHGLPAGFEVGKVIDGWNEALQLMPEGSIWILYIPSELAYGKKGSPPNILPDTTLIFEIELIKAY